jgi:hypothetical protein
VVKCGLETRFFRKTWFFNRLRIFYHFPDFLFPPLTRDLCFYSASTGCKATEAVAEVRPGLDVTRPEQHGQRQSGGGDGPIRHHHQQATVPAVDQSAADQREALCHPYHKERPFLVGIGCGLLWIGH